jgi:rare lipoprotein A
MKNLMKNTALVVASVFLALAFASHDAKSEYKSSVITSKIARDGTRVEIGDVFVGKASYYGKRFHGRQTANQERFNMYAQTAAHKTLPFGTVAKVTNLENGASTIVRINDRGPYVNKDPGRILDLSRGAAVEIGSIHQGVARVEIEVIRFDPKTKDSDAIERRRRARKNAS